MDKVIITDSTKCKSGHYTGKIIKAESRVQPSKDKKTSYDMKDYSVQVDVSATEKPELKVGFFKNISVSSDLIKFINKLGFNTAVKTELDLDCVVGTVIEFDVINETRGNGTYSNIAVNTITKKQ